VKKVNKNNPALHSNNPTLQWVFGGQIAPSPWHYKCNVQIICIGEKKTLTSTPSPSTVKEIKINK
jgi:hypothetical protein